MNIRHIGLLRSLIENQKIKDVLLLESIARSIKSHLNLMFRIEMQKCSVPSEKPFRQVVIDLFNLIIKSNQEFSDVYWNIQLKKILQSKFETILTSDEEKDDFDLFQHISIFELFKRLQELTQVKIAESALQQIGNDHHGFEFVDPDIDLGVKVAHLNLIDFADGMALYYEAENRTDNVNTQLRLLDIAQARLKSSLSQSGNSNFNAILQLGNITRSLAIKQVNFNKEEKLIEATKVFERVTTTTCGPQIKYQAYYLWAKTLWNIVKINKTFEDDNSNIILIKELLTKAENLEPKEISIKILRAKICFNQAFYNLPDAVLKLEECLDIIGANNTTEELVPDCLIMKARVNLLQILFEFKNGNPEELLPKIKQFAEQTEKLLSKVPDVDILKHFTSTSILNTLLLSICQYSQKTMKIICEFFEKGRKNNLIFDTDTLQWLESITFVSNLSWPSLVYITFDNVNLSEWKDIFNISVESLTFKSTTGSIQSYQSIILKSNTKELILSSISLSESTEENSNLLSTLPSNLTSLRIIKPNFSINDDDISTIVSNSLELQELALEEIDGITDTSLTTISGMKTLSTLILTGLNIEDIDSLSQISSLNNLSIKNCGFAKMALLNKNSTILPNLKKFVSTTGLLNYFTRNERVGDFRITKPGRSDAVLQVESYYFDGIYILVRKPIHQNILYFDLKGSIQSPLGPQVEEQTIASVQLTPIGPSITCLIKCPLYNETSKITINNSGMVIDM